MALQFNLSNGRGDIVAQTSSAGAIVWTASYEAYGKQTKETGTNNDTQRANSKEEDPTGLLNEGFRYRDLDTGVWLSRDPAGFVDGPNLYACVLQNPWTAWDPHGLKIEVKRTPKTPRPSGVKLTTAQRSAEQRRQNTSGENTHTDISYDAVLIDRTSKGLSKGNMDMIKSNLKTNLERTYSGEDWDKNQSWSMKANIKIVSSDKEIKSDDHVIAITDTVIALPLFGEPKELGGFSFAPESKDKDCQLSMGVIP